MLSVQPQQTTTPPATPLTIPHATLLSSPHKLQKTFPHPDVCSCVRALARDTRDTQVWVPLPSAFQHPEDGREKATKDWEQRVGVRGTASGQQENSNLPELDEPHRTHDRTTPHHTPNAFASRFHPAPKTPNSQGKQDRMLPSITPPATLLTLPHATLLSSPHELQKPSHIQTCARACVRSRATHSKARSGCHCPQPPVGLNTVTVQFHIPTDFEGGAECISAPGRWKGKGHRRLGAESG
jgi:hypothetical protein